MVFQDGGNVVTAKEFARFMVGEGWLAHWLDFSGERFLPTLPKLLEQPYWLDPNDKHRMAAVMQISSRPMQLDYAAASGNWRHQLVDQEKVWPKTIHRVVTQRTAPSGRSTRRSPGSRRP